MGPIWSSAVLPQRLLDFNTLDIARDFHRAESTGQNDHPHPMLSQNSLTVVSVVNASNEIIYTCLPVPGGEVFIRGITVL